MALDNGRVVDVPIIRVTKIKDPGVDLLDESRLKKAGDLVEILCEKASSGAVLDPTRLTQRPEVLHCMIIYIDDRVGGDLWPAQVYAAVAAAVSERLKSVENHQKNKVSTAL